MDDGSGDAGGAWPVEGPVDAIGGSLNGGLSDEWRSSSNTQGISPQLEIWVAMALEPISQRQRRRVEETRLEIDEPAALRLADFFFLFLAVIRLRVY